jgi:uncharacterized surface protein with fasciclin (FAS1) repeats
VKAAGIEQTMAGAGAYTLFAPTNAAFQKLPAGAAEGLMRPESKAELTNILTYHVRARRGDFEGTFRPRWDAAAGRRGWQPRAEQR